MSYPLQPLYCCPSGSSVLHHFLEFVQTHVYWVNDAILSSHPLSLPSPPALNLPSIMVFSNESALCITWPTYWSFCISPSNEYSGLISFRIDWFDLFAVQVTLKSFQQQAQNRQFFSAQFSLWSSSHIHTWLLEKTVAVTIWNLCHPSEVSVP